MCELFYHYRVLTFILSDVSVVAFCQLSVTNEYIIVIVVW